MEKMLTNGFCEMSQDERMQLDGGIGPVGWCIIGYLGSVIVDGVVTAATGKSTSGWVAEGINAIF